MEKKYDEIMKKVQNLRDENFLGLLNDLRYGFISDVGLIHNEQNIHNILDKKENLETIKTFVNLIYEEKKSQLTEEKEISNLTKKYHEDLLTLDNLHNDLNIAKNIREFNAVVMKDFVNDSNLIKKISEHPNWYVEENTNSVDVAVHLRTFLEIDLLERIKERKYSRDWTTLTDILDDMIDKSKTRKTIEKMYESLGLDSDIKDLSSDYFENPQKLAEKIEETKIPLQEVLYPVSLNLILEPSNIEPLSHILKTDYGKDILSYIDLHSDIDISKKFKDIYNYIHNNEITESLKININISTLKNLTSIKEDMYEEWEEREYTDSRLTLEESKVFDISSLINEGNLVKAEEFNKFLDSYIMCKVNDKIYDLSGIYYDVQEETVKIALNNYYKNEKEPTVYSLSKEKFLEASNELFKNEFEDEEVKSRTISKHTDLEKTILSQLERIEFDY